MAGTGISFAVSHVLGAITVILLLFPITLGAIITTHNRRSPIKIVYCFVDKYQRLHLHPGKHRDLEKHGAGWLALYDIPPENDILVHDLTGKTGSWLYRWSGKYFQRRADGYGLSVHSQNKWQAIYSIKALTERDLGTIHLYLGEVLSLIPNIFNWSNATSKVVAELLKGQDPIDEREKLIKQVNDARGRLAEIQEHVGKELVSKSRPPKWAGDIFNILTKIKL